MFLLIALFLVHLIIGLVGVALILSLVTGAFDPPQRGSVSWAQLELETKLELEKSAARFQPKERVRVFLSCGIFAGCSIRGKLLLSGGAIEAGETPADAVCRELAEKLEVTIKDRDSQLQYLCRRKEQKYANEHVFIVHGHGLWLRDYIDRFDSTPIFLWTSQLDDPSYVGPQLDEFFAKAMI